MVSTACQTGEEVGERTANMGRMMTGSTVGIDAFGSPLNVH